MVLPLDMPDDYIWQPGSGKSQLADLGELAVRLGSTVTYDRRGSVYWYDDFENGIGAWQVTGAGTEFLARYVSTHVQNGLLSMKIYTGSGSQDTVVVKKRLSSALLTTYGLEVTFSVGNNVAAFSPSMVFSKSDERIEPGIIIFPYTSTLVITDADEGQVTIATVPIVENSEFLFHTVKFTYDFINNKYGRLMFDRFSWDISSYSAPTGAPLAVEELTTEITAVDNASGEGASFIDNVIVTVGDP